MNYYTIAVLFTVMLLIFWYMSKNKTPNLNSKTFKPKLMDIKDKPESNKPKLGLTTPKATNIVAKPESINPKPAFIPPKATYIVAKPESIPPKSGFIPPKATNIVAQPIKFESKPKVITDKSSANDIVSDIDGNKYHTIVIGTQVWMLENLRTTKYRNGDPILEVTDMSTWVNKFSGAFCWYNNDPVRYKGHYGALYNWKAVVDPRSISPKGWHVPSDDEWTVLENYLGGKSDAGSKLKEADTSHWKSPNMGANNKSGFTALPGGCCAVVGIFDRVDTHGFWWSSTPFDAEHAWFRNLSYIVPIIHRNNYFMQGGFSVRCIQD